MVPQERVSKTLNHSRDLLVFFVLFVFVFIQKSGSLYGVQIISIVRYQREDNNQRPTGNTRLIELSRQRIGALW